MDQHRREGDWLRFKGLLRQRWGNLTSDDLDVIEEGDWDRLLGRIQQRYGMTKEQAQHELRTWQRTTPCEGVLYSTL